ncbi:MAG: hypothetical protein J7L61_00080 [Thermoplasmata archaeon]|nr:hypothetical protein [Thermoplasmata archaeon]
MTLKKSELVANTPQENLQLYMEEKETLREKFSSFVSGVKYTFILTLMLWWIPVIGQAVAGYIGGRRAGTAYRGFLAAMVPVFAFLGLSKLYTGYWLPAHGPLSFLLGGVYAAVSSYIPFIVPYANFATLYLGEVAASIAEVGALRVGQYSIVIVFAFIGGLMAEQTRREIRAVLRHIQTTSQTPPLSLIKKGVSVEQVVWTRYGGGGHTPMKLEDLTPVGARAVPDARGPKAAGGSRSRTASGKTSGRKNRGRASSRGGRKNPASSSASVGSVSD